MSAADIVTVAAGLCIVFSPLLAALLNVSLPWFVGANALWLGVLAALNLERRR